MPDDESESSGLVKVATSLFRHIEHFVYFALGVLLSIAALLTLSGAAFELWRGMHDWSSGGEIFEVINRLLFVLLLIEILHTIRASIRSGELTAEPFLVVGLIASIRRVLVITLQTSEQTRPGSITTDGEHVLQASLAELAVLGGLILILVLSLYLLGRMNRRS